MCPTISSFDSFTVEVKNETNSYSYVFQLCGDVGGLPGAGIIQLDSKKTGTKPTIIGTYNFTEVIGGSKLSSKMNTLSVCNAFTDNWNHLRMWMVYVVL